MRSGPDETTIRREMIDENRAAFCSECRESNCAKFAKCPDWGNKEQEIPADSWFSHTRKCTGYAGWSLARAS